MKIFIQIILIFFLFSFKAGFSKNLNSLNNQLDSSFHHKNSFQFLHPKLSSYRKILISIGEEIHLPIVNNQIIQSGKKGVISLHNDKDQILRVRGKQLGFSHIYMGEITYHIIILEKNKKEIIKKLDKMLKKFLDLKWSFINNHLEIIGTLQRISDWLELFHFFQKNPIPYSFKAKIGEGLEDSLGFFFDHFFKEKNQIPPKIDWSKIPNVFIPSQSLAEEYKNSLPFFGLIAIKDPRWFKMEKWIGIEIATIEFNSSSFSSFGNLLKNEANLSFIQFLNLIKKKGSGKIIHHSHILTKNGKKIHLQSGGSIPFTKVNLNTQTQSTQWKNYGMNIEAIPFLDSKNQIQLQLKLKISEPNASHSVNELPSLKEETIQTDFILKNKEIVRIFHQNKNRFSSGYSNHFNPFSFLWNFIKDGIFHQTSQSIFLKAKILHSAHLPILNKRSKDFFN